VDKYIVAVRCWAE